MLRQGFVVQDSSKLENLILVTPFFCYSPFSFFLLFLFPLQMSASGNRPASVSPPPRPRTNTQWQTTTAPPPQPLSPLANSRQQHATNATTTANGDNDISLRHILDRYKDDPELLKHILKAKVEEDKVW